MALFQVETQEKKIKDKIYEVTKFHKNAVVELYELSYMFEDLTLLLEELYEKSRSIDYPEGELEDIVDRITNTGEYVLKLGDKVQKELKDAVDKLKKEVNRCIKEAESIL